MAPVILLIALATSMPLTDLNKVCQSAKVGALPEDQPHAFESCIQDEKTARDQLQQEWSHFSNNARDTCREQPGTAFSYVELLTCLEMQSGGNNFTIPKAPAISPAPSAIPSVDAPAPKKP